MLLERDLSALTFQKLKLHVSQVTLYGEAGCWMLNVERTLIHVPLKIHDIDTGTILAAVSYATS
jgi:hypothetical protein